MTRRSDWVSYWDDEEGRWISWSEAQSEPYRKKQQAKLFRNLQHPMFWLLKSEQLHQAAGVLWDADASTTKLHSPVVFMLAGMSLENLIKGRRVCGEAWPLTDDRYSNVARGRHHLDEEAVRAGFRTNQFDRAVLKTLAHYVRWAGRYMLPKTLDDFYNGPPEAETTQEALWEAYVSLKSKLYRQCIRAIRTWSRRLPERDT